MKKIISIFLSLLLLLSTLSVAASAFEGKPPLTHNQSKIFDLTHLDPSTVIDTSKKPKTVNAINFLSDGASTPHKFYSYLDKNQRAVYNNILSDPLQEAYFIDAPISIEFDAYVDSDDYVDIPEYVMDAVGDMMIGAVSAVIEDNPMIFWIDSIGFDFNLNNNYRNPNGSYHFIVRQFLLETIFERCTYKSLDIVKSRYNQLTDAVKDFTITGTTRYEKVKSIHDNIAKQATYDPNYENPNYNQSDFDPTGPLLSPYLTVCEGYAESFKLICDREGIPCIIVSGLGDGGPHAWNYVKMEDNKWYAVDLTWDDQGRIFEDFFLVGGNSIPKNFDKERFADSHKPLGNKFSGSDFTLTYPNYELNSYKDNLKNLTGLEIKAPNKVDYVPGDMLDLTGLVVKAVYNYSEKVELDKSEYTVTGFNSEQIGTQAVTVTHRGTTATFNVNVAEKKPDSPTTVNKENVTIDSIDITWSAVSNATGYNVYVDGVLNNASPITDTKYTITGLSATTKYSITIKAVNTAGESENGTTISVKTVGVKFGKGDVNGDGLIDAADGIFILRYDANLVETLSDEQKAAADVTGDEIIDSADAIKIARYDAEIITKL